MADRDEAQYEAGSDAAASVHEEPEIARTEEAWGAREGGSPWAWLVVVLLLLVGGVAVWWFALRQPQGEPAPAASDREAPAEIPAAPPVAPAEPAMDPELGDVRLDESDPVVRHIAAALSSHPKLTDWVARQGLLRRVAKAVGNIAYEEDPRSHVQFLQPSRSFEAEAAPRPEDPRPIDPRSYERFDLMTDVFVSLDPEETVAAYRRLQPLLEEAYRELGYPGTFEEDLRRAIRSLLATPDVPADQRLVVPWIRSYRFADPELEGLADAQKQLLRMGPDNQRRVEAHLRRMLEELG